MLRFEMWTIVALLLFTSVPCALAQPRPGDPTPGPEGDHHVLTPHSDVAVHASYNGYDPGKLDESVWQLQTSIKAVRQRWVESIKDGDSNKQSIQASALDYAVRLAAVPDNSLGLGALIVRDEYACYGYVIAAANSVSSQKRTLGERSEELCKRAASHLSTANDLKFKDSSARAVADWASHSDEQPRILYLAAMSSCLQSAGAAHDPKLKAAQALLKSIAADYLSRFPPAKDVVLNRCVANWKRIGPPGLDRL